ncbi:MAG: hypothetical protein ACYCQJ_14950 [Nitrososphaerales archaeon]
MVTVTYSCLSEGGQAIFRNAQGQEIFRVNQFRNIMVIIDQQGNLSWKDMGYHPTNVVRYFLFNPFRYGMNVSYLDNNRVTVWPGEGTFNSDCSSPFFTVPYIGKSHYMVITLNLVPKIVGYSGNNIGYSLTVVGREIIFESPSGQTAYPWGDIAFNLDETGNVSITSIPDPYAFNCRLAGVVNPYNVKYMLYDYLTGYSYSPNEYCLVASAVNPFVGFLEFKQLALYIFPTVVNPCEGKPCGGQCDNQTCPAGYSCQLQPGGYYACTPAGCLVCAGTCNVQSCPTGFECKLQPDGNYGCSPVVTPCTTCGGTCNVQSCPVGFECKLQPDGNYGCSAVVTPCTTCGGTCNVQSCGTGFECKLQPDGNYGCSAVVNPCAGKPCGGNCDGPCAEGECIKNDKGVYSCVVPAVPLHKKGWFIGLMVGVGVIIIIIILALVIWSVKKKQEPEEPDKPEL